MRRSIDKRAALLLAGLAGVLALAWILGGRRTDPQPIPVPTRLEGPLRSGQIARMDSPAFAYGSGWVVDPVGADTLEPPDPWTKPSGRVTFSYVGETLALQLAVGDYWGYVYVTVDGAPANRLPVIRGNVNSEGVLAGYKPLLAPERQTPRGPDPSWVVVHAAADAGPHQVTVEVWRSWGQIPLRAVAVDALPSAPLPLWPGVALGLSALWLGGFALAGTAQRWARSVRQRLPTIPLRLPKILVVVLLPLGIGLVVAGVVLNDWLLTNLGLGSLALVGLFSPVLWTAALLFALPFYLHPLPILPGRALNLIEIGVWGGLALLAGHWLIGKGKRQKAKGKNDRATSFSPWKRSSPQLDFYSPFPLLILAAIVTLALVVAVAADQRAVALREWRTLFLAALGFGLLLLGSLHNAPDLARALHTLVLSWLLGGTVVALIGIGQYATGEMIIQAEGVERVRALYGSPNNLALYLERTAAVGLALALFGRGSGTHHPIRSSQFAPRPSLFWLLTIPQLFALLLTFSKGALLLALPAILVVLTAGGYGLLRRRGESLRPLWGLAAVALAMVIGLVPFLEAERFRRLFDFGQGTTGGLRLNLWRSSWHMALDHPWLGVGPDNFLYTYRSGYILPTVWQDPNLNHPHNVILDWWTRLGLGGLLLAGLWLWTGVRSLWQRLSDPQMDVLALGFGAAIVGALAHGSIDASYALPDLMLVWVLLLTPMWKVLWPPTDSRPLDVKI